MMISRRQFAGAISLFAFALLGLEACEGPGAAPPAGASPSSAVGSVHVELQIAASIQLDTVTYQIARGDFQKAGSWDVSHSATLAGVIGGLPSATGYALALQATDHAHRLVGCDGSSMFDVVAGATTPVAVHLTCHELRQPSPAAVPIPPATRVVLAIVLPLMGALALRRRGRSARPTNS